MKATKASVQEVKQSSAAKALSALRESKRKELGFLVRNAHAVAKQNRPLSDYTWLNALDKAKGVEIGDTYLSEKAGFGFIKTIAQIEQQRLLSMCTSGFFSIIMDGSTDISGHEQETLYVRLCVDGNPTLKFMSIGSPSSTKSCDLIQYIESDFQKSGFMELAEKGII